jgi:hypothetical protein
MVWWNRFGHSQAGRPTLRGGWIDGGGWVKKARTNKPNVEWGSIWSTAPSAVFRTSAQSVAVSGGAFNRESLFSSLVGGCRLCAGDRVVRLGVVRPASKTVAAPYSKSERRPPLFVLAPQGVPGFCRTIRTLAGREAYATGWMDRRWWMGEKSAHE